MKEFITYDGGDGGAGVVRGILNASYSFASVLLYLYHSSICYLGARVFVEKIV